MFMLNYNICHIHFTLKWMKPQGLPLVNVTRKWLLPYKKPYSVVMWGLQIVDGVQLL
jgi:hypothetical protein